MITGVHPDDVPVAAGFERLVQVLRRLAPRDELSLTASSTLRRLEHTGPHRLCDLTAPEGVSQPAMTQLVTRLEKDGLAVRGSDPADGRAVVVSITETGRDVVRRRRAAWGEALSGLLHDLSAEDRAAIDAALPALHRLADLADQQAT